MIGLRGIKEEQIEAKIKRILGTISPRGVNINFLLMFNLIL